MTLTSWAREAERTRSQCLSSVIISEPSTTASAANVSTGYKFLPFEVNARNVYADHADGAFTDKSITLEEGIASWETALKEYAEQQGYTVE